MSQTLCRSVHTCREWDFCVCHTFICCYFIFSFYNELKLSGVSDLGFAVFSKCVVPAILVVFRKTSKEDIDLI